MKNHKRFIPMFFIAAYSCIRTRAKYIFFGVLILAALIIIAFYIFVKSKYERGPSKSLENYPWPIGNENTMEFHDTVTVAISEGSLAPNGAEFLFSNNSNGIIDYGSEFFIQIEIDGKWYNIEWDKSERFGQLTPAWPLWAESIRAETIKQYKESWGAMYGDLPSGNYRYIKNFFFSREFPPDDRFLPSDFYSICPFTIG